MLSSIERARTDGRRSKAECTERSQRVTIVDNNNRMNIGEFKLVYMQINPAANVYSLDPDAERTFLQNKLMSLSFPSVVSHILLRCFHLV